LPKFTPPKVYTNRSQWQGATAYKAFKKPYDDLKNQAHLSCEMAKYGEIRALLSGITTIEGTAPNSRCFGVLVRNAENQNQLGLPSGHVRTFILDIKSFKGTVDFSKTKSFVVHLAEGINDSARAEFQTLKQKGLLHKETAIIHGTAFGDAEFAEMGQVGASLIWSPESNLVLYQQTTNIPLAKQHGVNVSIGVDWNPTGSDTIFDELRVADNVNTGTFNGAIDKSEWLPMITTNPAKALALDALLGRLAPGFKADITVIASQDSDPSVNLLKTHPADVRMVWVGGRLLYGDKAFVEAVRGNTCEVFVLKGVQKRLCIADAGSSVPKHNQTLQNFQATLLVRYPQLAPLTR
jgi:5-methylthioadenosine/S-adenosylhomocysteine deaminase